MSRRTDQVESVVQHTVALSLREHLSTGAVVTVTGVEVSPDLKQGLIWVGILGGETEAVMKDIENVRRAVQSDLNSQMKSKFVPRLKFKLDKGGEYADHINQVLKRL